MATRTRRSAAARAMQPGPDVDVKRVRPTRLPRFVTLGGGAVVLVAVGVIAIARRGPRRETLRRSEAWIGRVQRGSLVIRVRGAGTLVPEEVRWLTAETSGRVEEILLKPGAAVAADTPIIRLENLDVRLQAVQADREVANARAAVMTLARNLDDDEIAREADVAQLRTTTGEAQRLAHADSKTQEVVSQLDLRRDAEKAKDLEVRATLAEKRLALLRHSGPAQVDVLKTQLAACVEIARLRHEMVDHLSVAAGGKGTLENVFVELGQWVVPGTNVARVILSERLKAELEIPEEQAGGIAVGQPATLDTGSTTAKGHVRRVASAAREGTVRVEIALDGDLPPGARPGQNVEGFVQIDRVDHTLYAPRPTGAQPNAAVSLFRVDRKTSVARRVAVHTGRASVDSIEILSGLAAGDEVILSDTSRYAGVDSIVLE